MNTTMKQSSQAPGIELVYSVWHALLHRRAHARLLLQQARAKLTSPSKVCCCFALLESPGVHSVAWVCIYTRCVPSSELLEYRF